METTTSLILYILLISQLGAGLPLESEPDAVQVKQVDLFCGLRSDPEKDSKYGKIVGGVEVESQTSWPWMVSLQTNGRHRFGATLLTPNWVITTAHSVVHYKPDRITARLREYNISSSEDGPLPVVDAAVVEIKIHPDYNSYSFENDIALLRIVSVASDQDQVTKDGENEIEDLPQQLPKGVQTICLPPVTKNESYTGQIGTILGWGRISEGGPTSEILREGQVPIISNAECEAQFLKAGYQELIPYKMLCAGLDQGGSDACQGDSGGPLLVESESGRSILAGLTSWGKGCAEAHKPGVYTRVSEFLPWIQGIIDSPTSSMVQSVTEPFPEYPWDRVYDTLNATNSTN